MQNLILLEKALRLLKVENENILIKNSVEFREDENGRKYVAFSLQENNLLHGFVMTFQDDEVIGDISGLFGYCDLIEDAEADTFTKYTAWIFTEAMLMHAYLVKEQNADFDNNFLIIESSYVNKRQRRQGIFSTMLDMLTQMVHKVMDNGLDLHMIMSLDPDFACYGEDLLEKEYVYDLEKDEPLREINKEIATHCFFNVMEIVNDHVYNKQDGTRKWFAIKYEPGPSSKPLLS